MSNNNGNSAHPPHPPPPKDELDPNSELTFVDSGYGKNYIKLLFIRREGPTHYIKEFEVNTKLTLDSKKDYLFGDNSDIVATDSQKNTVYILAKHHGVKSPEEFALLLCSHFLSKYAHINKATVCIEEHPWDRLVSDGVPHNHAFISSPVATRFSSVVYKRGGTKMKTAYTSIQIFI
jgi:urate oxidase